MDYIKSLIPYFPENKETISKDLYEMIDFYRLSENIDNDHQGFRGYQKVIQLLFNPNTNLKHILLKHNPGSGKTRTALGVIITFVLNDKKNIYIITPNKSQTGNIRSILLQSLSELKEYTNDDIMAIRSFISRMQIISFLDLTKIKTFINIPPDLIIMDEVHMIHFKQNKTDNFIKIDSGLNIYQIIKYVFNSLLYKKTKIILMTGTPIVNDYKKLFEIMDLILPIELQFNDKIINKKIVNLDVDTKKFLEKRFLGRVSSVNIKFKSISEINIGDYLDKISLEKSSIKTKTSFSIPLFFNVTVGYQNDKIKYSTNTEDLFFAFPDDMDYSSSVVERSSKFLEWKNLKLKKLVTDKNFLKEHSIFYYNLIHFIGGIFNEKNNEAIFIYNNTNKTTGNKLLSLILKTYGLKEIIKSTEISKIKNEVDMNQEIITNPYKRFVVITSLFGINNDEQIDKLVYIFSHTNNKYGKYLKLIIGSDKMTISYNLINGRQVHVVLQNNSSIMDQAIARIIRGVTHLSPEESYAKIYRHFISSETVSKTDEFYNRLVSCENNLNLNDQIISIFDKSSIDYFINRKLNKIKAPKVILNSIINYKNINVEEKIISFLKDFLKTNNYIYIKDIQLKLDLSYVETMYYISDLMVNKKLFLDTKNIYKSLTYFRNILFLGYTNDISELLFKTKLLKQINHYEIDQLFLLKSFDFNDFYKQLINGKNMIQVYSMSNIFVKMLIFEIIISRNFKNKLINDFKDSLIKIEYEKFIINETNELNDIEIAHILLNSYFNINFNIVSGMRIFSNGKWVNLNNKEITSKLHKEIKNKVKLLQPELIIPFKTIYSWRNGEFVSVKKDNLNKKGWKCKTLLNKEIEDYKKEIDLFIRENNIPITDQYRLEDESSIEFNYRMQQQILHYLNPGINFEL